MNPAADNLQSSSQKNTTNSDLQTQPVSVATTVGKEAEPSVVKTETVRDAGVEVDIPKEVERVGVSRISATIELPPDVKKLGVAQTGGSVTTTAIKMPNIVLPITDDTVYKGQSAGISESVRWLAVWCLKKLQKAHIGLKKFHGKIIRVLIKS